MHYGWWGHRRLGEALAALLEPMLRPPLAAR
jgi:hypothetical protein